MRYEDITPAYVRSILGLPNDPRLSIEIDWDGRDFHDTWCARTDQPAAVHIEYTLIDVDDEGPFPVTEIAAYSWEYAGRTVRALLADTALSEDTRVRVDVLGWAAMYAPQQVAA